MSKKVNVEKRADEIQEEMRKLKSRMRKIKHKIVVLSGKGGVGKSTITVNLAMACAMHGYGSVGILDADITGPSVPKILGLKGQRLQAGPPGVFPAIGPLGIRVVSMDFLLPTEETPVIWRGPLKTAAIRQFLSEFIWGELDCLFIDLPPGCLTKDTLVLTNPHGPIPISKVKPGDYIYSFEGKIRKTSEGYRKHWMLDAKLVKRKVADVIPQGTSTVYELKTKTRAIRSTSDHPILALRKMRAPKKRFYSYELAWTPLAKLRSGDMILIVKKIPDEGAPFKMPEVSETWKMPLKIPVYTTEDFMRVVGYFLGDGSVRLDRKGRYWGVWFSEPKSGKYRAKYIELLKRVFGASHIYERNEKFALISKQVAELFDKLGLNYKTKEKRIPEWVFTLPTSQKLALIEGLCDADGSRGDKRLNIELSNHRLIEQVRELCISVGLRVTNVYGRGRWATLPRGGKTYGTSWSFEIYPNTALKYYGARLIRAGREGKCGKGLFNEYIGFDTVKSVTYVGEENIYDLRVEGNHNFVANGMIVHNTGDESLSIMQFIPDIDGAVIVTIPSEVSQIVVKKAVSFARKLNIPVIGIIENMSGFVCPKCGAKTEIFRSGGGKEIADDMDVPFLGSIPIDPKICEDSDKGMPFIINHPDSPSTEAFKEIVKKVEASLKEHARR